MRRRALLMGGNTKPNTIIGGIGGTINTKALLATKLGISESIIRGFKVVGSDVHCKITTSFTSNVEAFRDDYTLLFYNDLDGKLTVLGTGTFRNTGLESLNLPGTTSFSSGYEISYNQYLKYLTLPNLTVVYSQSLRNNTGLLELHAPNLESIGNIVTGGQNNFFDSYSSCNLISMRKLKVYGHPSNGTTGTLSGFTGLKTNCTIEVHEDLATANAGAPNQSLIWAKTNRSAIVKFYDNSGNYVSTL